MLALLALLRGGDSLLLLEPPRSDGLVAPLRLLLQPRLCSAVAASQALLEGAPPLVAQLERPHSASFLPLGGERARTGLLPQSFWAEGEGQRA